MKEIARPSSHLTLHNFPHQGLVAVFHSTAVNLIVVLLRYKMNSPLGSRNKRDKSGAGEYQV